MIDLPDDVSTTPPSQPAIGVASIGGSKEKELASGDTEAPFKGSGTQEFELPKEVASVGVRTQPTTVPVPPPVAKLGVKPIGANVPLPTQTVALPLTDDQIVQGLRQSVTSSFRWFAEWCLRRLKQLHIAVKTVGGKLVRF